MQEFAGGVRKLNFNYAINLKLILKKNKNINY